MMRFGLAQSDHIKWGLQYSWRRLMGLVWALSQTISDYYNQMITLSKLPFLLNEASNRYVGNEDLLNLPKPMDNIICDPIKWGLVYCECFTKAFQFVFTGPRQ